jgi:hypothetical protein
MNIKDKTILITAHKPPPNSHPCSTHVRFPPRKRACYRDRLPLIVGRTQGAPCSVFATLAETGLVSATHY